jgi:hypothetical protein
LNEKGYKKKRSAAILKSDYFIIRNEIFKLSENCLYDTDFNLSDHSRYKNFKKIRLLGTKLLAKIKLELTKADVIFVYTSHSYEYIGYWSIADPNWNSSSERKVIGYIKN